MDLLIIYLRKFFSSKEKQAHGHFNQILIMQQNISSFFLLYCFGVLVSKQTGEFFGSYAQSIRRPNFSEIHITQILSKLVNTDGTELIWKSGCCLGLLNFYFLFLHNTRGIRRNSYQIMNDLPVYVSKGLIPVNFQHREGRSREE